MKLLLRLELPDYDLMLTAIDLAAEHPECSADLLAELDLLLAALVSQGPPLDRTKTAK